VFNAFEEIFAPGRKHTDDERNRLALTRVDTADGDPGRGPIDLASGKVTVRAQTPRPNADDVPADAPADDVPADAPADVAGGGGAPGREPRPGQAADATDDDAPGRPGPGRTRDAGGDGDGNGAAARP
jgi:hypothetical protein